MRAERSTELRGGWMGCEVDPRFQVQNWRSSTTLEASSSASVAEVHGECPAGLPGQGQSDCLTL